MTLSNLQADPENQFGLEKFWNQPIREGNGVSAQEAVSRRGNGVVSPGALGDRAEGNDDHLGLILTVL